MEKIHPATINNVATVNNTKIFVITNGEKRIAINPVCQALGISKQGQLERLKSDPILGSTVKMIFTVGSDQKQREMATIPFKFVFGWLFRIDARKVKPEAQESVMKYQMECYDALYRHFTELEEYMEDRTKLVEQKMDVIEEARNGYKDASKRLDAAKRAFAEARSMTLDSWRESKSQLKLNFEEAFPIPERSSHV